MQYHYLLLFCKAGGGGKYYCLGARWADGEGEGGKIIMNDFLKRGGESIILFSEKELKPEGRGRGRGGHYFTFFARPGGRGEYYCLGARWADGEGGRGGDYYD